MAPLPVRDVATRMVSSMASEGCPMLKLIKAAGDC